VLTSTYARCATLEYYSLCTFARLSTGHCNVLINHLLQTALTSWVCVLKCVRFFWLAACRKIPYFDHWCSVYSAPMPAIPIQLLTTLLYRGEWYSRLARVFKITTSTAVSSFEVSILLWSNWGFRHYHLVHTSVDPCHRKCHAGWWAYPRFPHWLDSNII